MSNTNLTKTDYELRCLPMTKHYTETKDWATQTLQKQAELECLPMTKHYTETKDWATQTLQKQTMNSGAYLCISLNQSLKECTIPFDFVFAYRKWIYLEYFYVWPN